MTTMMSSLLLLLNYDTLSTIASKLSANTLLNLTLTCRTMQHFIIPEFLYARVCLSLKENTQPKLIQLESFYRSITADGSMAGDAVRHLELDAPPLYPRADTLELLQRALGKLLYLRKVVLSGALNAVGGSERPHRPHFDQDHQR
ncbi:hypothetical protein BOTBODRAFT_235086 [Botryobasidium botryosum FD-172 SS1]|uniref:F-box domain-containing protein n=1 Tax=Botryobasidium botryosum (strain FD-172 SS1) TaxID=930990 RepID=A0A067LUL3_BOTB1|nr:hypothetical protein BOTBODRAFT_235086 [Botryobasidium botryosum FD-172 SS1]